MPPMPDPATSVRAIIEASGVEATDSEIDAGVAAFGGVLATAAALLAFDPTTVAIEWDLDPSREPSREPSAEAMT